MGSFHVEDRLNSALLGNFDVDLHTFYLEAITKELDVSNRQNVRDIMGALKVVVEAYNMRKTDVENVDEKSIRFDSSAKRCAYVLKHSACFTSAVARHVLGLATVFPRVFNNAIHQHGRSETTPTFNLCCLGGGPGSDAVGFCKVLSAFCGTHSRQKLKLKVTVVDINEDWKDTAGNVLETLSGAPWMERIELTLGFVQADLTRPFEKDVKKVLGSADVVTMVYFLSAVNRGKDSIVSLQMVQEIMKCMQNNGVLFVLDSAKGVHYNQVSSASESLGNMVQVYSPRIEEFHALSMDSVRKFLHLYKRYFGRYLCLTNCFVSSSAWCKLSPPLLESKYKTANVAVCGKLIVLDCNEEYANKSHVVLLNRSVNWSMSCFQEKHLTMEKSIALNSLPGDKFPLMEKPPSSKNLQEEARSTDKPLLTINNLQHKFWSMEKSVTVNNLQDKFWLTDQPLPANNLDDSSCVVDKTFRIISEKASKCSINCNKENGCKPLPVERMQLDKCSFSNQDESLVQKNTQNVPRLSGKQLRFRAQINRLLTDEFEHFYIKEEIFDEIDYPYDDTFDTLLNEYIHLVPKYFFQTKSKKRRIFTEWM